jgi:2-polyprenyl-6-methoxyphenol hydroxylase-like FAD-dependent oxidoreductase
MSTILILGGGVVGLSTAMMLARDGHSVTVFEHDSERFPARRRKLGNPGDDVESLSFASRTSFIHP